MVPFLSLSLSLTVRGLFKLPLCRIINNPHDGRRRQRVLDYSPGKYEDTKRLGWPEVRVRANSAA